jgi:hypothetical protein
MTVKNNWAPMTLSHCTLVFQCTPPVEDDGFMSLVTSYKLQFMSHNETYAEIQEKVHELYFDLSFFKKKFRETLLTIIDKRQKADK